jgi:hypothetical protein
MSGRRKILGKAVRRLNWLAIPRLVSVVAGIEAALDQPFGGVSPSGHNATSPVSSLFQPIKFKNQELCQ